MFSLFGNEGKKQRIPEHAPFFLLRIQEVNRRLNPSHFRSKCLASPWLHYQYSIRDLYRHIATAFEKSFVVVFNYINKMSTSVTRTVFRGSDGSAFRRERRYDCLYGESSTQRCGLLTRHQLTLLPLTVLQIQITPCHQRKTTGGLLPGPMVLNVE